MSHDALAPCALVVLSGQRPAKAACEIKSSLAAQQKQFLIDPQLDPPPWCSLLCSAGTTRRGRTNTDDCQPSFHDMYTHAHTLMTL